MYIYIYGYLVCIYIYGYLLCIYIYGYLVCIYLQLLERSRSRRKRLEDALDDIHGSISLLEDLLTYLSDAEVLLLTKEEDETPEDMSLVEDLLKQHMVSCLLFIQYE